MNIHHSHLLRRAFCNFHSGLVFSNAASCCHGFSGCADDWAGGKDRLAICRLASAIPVALLPRRSSLYAATAHPGATHGVADSSTRHISSPHAPRRATLAGTRATATDVRSIAADHRSTSADVSSIDQYSRSTSADVSSIDQYGRSTSADVSSIDQYSRSTTISLSSIDQLPREIGVNA